MFAIGEIPPIVFLVPPVELIPTAVGISLRNDILSPDQYIMPMLSQRRLAPQKPSNSKTFSDTAAVAALDVTFNQVYT